MLLSLAAFLLAAPSPKPMVLAHTMPWYESQPVSGKWGWHWTMGKTDPGKGGLASHFHPLIGPYDSSDPAAVECQVQLMKLSGIDGVAIDWYGILDHYDYAIIHRNTQRLIDAAKRAGLKFAIVYEDQTVPQLIRGGKFPADRAVEEGRSVMRWVARHWFSDPAYLRWNGRPVFMVFGPQYYADSDWPKLLDRLPAKPAFLTLHRRRDSAVGAFDWPLPQGGTEEALTKIDRFEKESAAWPLRMTVAYPRFQDYYKQAGTGPGFDIVEDRGGETYRETLGRALRSGAPFVQIATWNDWGEGTGIEPTREFGFRDLEITQRSTGSPYKPLDLRLPVRLYELRKRPSQSARVTALLAKASALLTAGRPTQASAVLRTVEPISLTIDD